MTWADDDLRKLWRAAGGGFYGPHVEHADMEEARFLPWLRSLLQGHDARVTELLAANTREVERRCNAEAHAAALAAELRRAREAWAMTAQHKDF